MKSFYSYSRLFFLFVVISQVTFAANAKVKSNNQFQLSYSGTYTVGADGDFLTLNEALSAIQTEGITGPVNFRLISGIYTEQLTIQSIPGASQVNTITIESLTGNAADVTVRISANWDNNFTINLVNASHLRFRNLTLAALGSTYGRILTGSGEVNDLIVENVSLSAPANGSNNNRTIIYFDLVASNGIQFLNNTISGGFSGIYLNGSASNDVLTQGVVISGNEIRNTFTAGIELNRLSGPVVENNDVLINSSSTASYPFQLGNSKGAIRVLSNKFVGGTRYGLYMNVCESSPENKGLVANNVIVSRSAGIQSARFEGISNVRIIHNSIHNYSSGGGMDFKRIRKRNH